MQNTRKINDDVFYVGVNDRRITWFENTHPITRGMAYNSYVIVDEKTVLLDTIDKAGAQQFLENLDYVLKGRTLDYLVINHMEPDHCALIEDVVRKFKDVILVGNKKTFELLHQFYDIEIGSNFIEVKEGDTLSLGKRTLKFMMAPMVHWPEVMVTYSDVDKMIFTADAFGTFGALNGNIYADQIDFAGEWLDDSRRYFSNIIGKYGMQTNMLLKKLATLEIDYICPLHGPIWRDNIDYIINKYKTWASYQAEEKGVVIAFGSVYGNTEEAVDVLAAKLSELGVKNIKIHDTTSTDPSYVISDIFRYSTLVLASSTYNLSIFPAMNTLIHDIVNHNIQNRHVAIIENGSWAPTSGKQMRTELEKTKNNTFINEQIFSLKSTLKAEQLDQLDELAKAIAATVL
ncbi:MAG TPA: FprA family A-type flavoprotein [Bacilli bacterium]|nr:FprA family A-type flavoprotein [Bacilli bacterium]